MFAKARHLALANTTSSNIEKSRDLVKCLFFVIPAKAGIHKAMNRLDSRLRGNDDLDNTRINSKA